MVRLKASFPARYELVTGRFQFLMVRLKGRDNLFITSLNFISIPYGAIKRNLVFQFLMVRLKFQFLMVRLKALRNVSVA